MTNFSHSPPQPRTYYTLLGIDQDANPKEIEKAYKRQALVHHPDRNPNDSQTQSTNMFQKLAEAYEILRDPVKRRKYDIKVANTIALNADPSTAHARSSHGNVYPNRPASQQSNRPTNHSKRSSAYDLFAYPGEIPQYVPTPNRRPASTAPAFRPRAGSSAEPMTSTSKNLQRQPTAVHPESHQPKPVQKPFTQKINLKDLDSSISYSTWACIPSLKTSVSTAHQPAREYKLGQPSKPPSHSIQLSPEIFHALHPTHISPFNGHGGKVWMGSSIERRIIEDTTAENPTPIRSQLTPNHVTCIDRLPCVVLILIFEPPASIIRDVLDQP
ncbi:hypothetical protein Pst134EA_002833 [Puccinia striiformis f. sp. tritici]|uniref:hypothetical protein n=1 Tax=Puccinia striiformis f. sp. tritici TaxID=168172 RepID=UPI002007E7DE|nr:hypothetical protein Pst134EA_002833 [Puccinia striiformis f. sp. tritici]KAH9472210.1 hypothetical protein Pst134EA_002833 [Puccinia striiformis f. sp. tritici]